MPSARENAKPTWSPAIGFSSSFTDSPSGPLQYNFAVPNGSYTVRLKFAEIYFTQPGQRVFNIVINGQLVAALFDPIAAAGAANTAVDRSYTVTVAGGQIAIALNPIVQNPKISAIEIVSN